MCVCVCVSSVGKFCLIVTQVHCAREILTKFLLINFHEDRFRAATVVTWQRTTDNQNGFKGHRQGHRKYKSTRIRVKLKGG